MTYREFVVPSLDEFERVLGLHARPGDAVGVVSVNIGGGGGDAVAVELTIDTLGRSVSVVVRDQDREVAQLFREGATDLRLCEQPPEITVEFRTDDTTGKLKISIEPQVHIGEACLFT